VPSAMAIRPPSFSGLPHWLLVVATPSVSQVAAVPPFPLRAVPSDPPRKMGHLESAAMALGAGVVFW